MNRDNEILKCIQEDLKIQSYKGERQEHHVARSIYSALGIWIRTSTLDEDILYEDIRKIGVSKIHIINRCMPFLENMIEIYPEINDWFNTNRKKNPIEIIRKRLYNANELVDVGFKTDLALPYYESCILNNGYKIIRGLKKGNFNISIGLSQIENLSTQVVVENNNILDFYGLNSNSSMNTLNEFLKAAKWKKKDIFSGELFNKYSDSVFSNCWDRDCNLKNNDITLYKNGILDYGFIKKVENELYFCKISKYLILKYEVRRFMYALKGQVKNNATARFKRFREEKLIILKLYNALPQKEESIVMLLSWPVNNIEDNFNLVINENCWDFIKGILINLDIKLLEEF